MLHCFTHFFVICSNPIHPAEFTTFVFPPLSTWATALITLVQSYWIELFCAFIVITEKNMMQLNKNFLNIIIIYWGITNLVGLRTICGEMSYVRFVSSFVFNASFLKLTAVQHSVQHYSSVYNRCSVYFLICFIFDF